MLKQDKFKGFMQTRIAINTGTKPVEKPKDLESVHLFRVMIATMRQAEEDYLSKKSSQRVRASAAQTLFGLSFSPFPEICRILGIDHVRARATILEWRFKGKIGDPAFDFLTKEANAEAYEKGEKLPMMK